MLVCLDGCMGGNLIQVTLGVLLFCLGSGVVFSPKLQIFCLAFLSTNRRSG